MEENIGIQDNQGLNQQDEMLLVSKNRKKLKKNLLIGVGLLSIGGLSYWGYKYLKKKYYFCIEQKIEIKLLPKPVFKAICNYEKVYRYDERLNIAHDEFNKGNDVSIDIAGFLAFSTLETFLKQLIESLKPELLNNGQSGIISLCRSLRSIGKITREDYERIKSLVMDVRNNIIHGCLYLKEKVLDAIYFVNEFINKNILIYKDFLKLHLI